MRLIMTLKIALVVLSVSALLSRAQTTITAEQHYARMRADFEVVREDQRRLYAALQENQRLLELLTSRLDRVEQRLGAASPAGGTDASAREQVVALRNALAAETTARQRAIEQLAKQVADELTRLAKSVEAASKSGGSSRPRQQPAVTGDGGATPRVEAQGEYTVAAGDTLSTIAQAFGVTTRQLMAVNNLSDDLIRVGQKLIIPKP